MDEPAAAEHLSASSDDASDDEWLQQMDLMEQERAESLAAKAQMQLPGQKSFSTGH